MATRLRVVHESHCPEIGPICAVRDEPPHLHDQVLYVSELRGIVDYGIDDRWGVEAQLPVQLTRTTIEYRHLDGVLFVPDYPGIHHRNETLFGIGDPWLRARRSFFGDPLLLSVKAGVSIPLGRTQPNPFALGDAGKAHQHIQFGTGTFDPLLAVELSGRFGDFDLQSYAQAQLVLYEGQRGFRAGNRYALGVQLGWRFFTEWSVGASFDAINESTERWDGEIQQDGNLGRTDLLLGGMIAWSLREYRVAISAKTPVYQHVTVTEEGPSQLTYPLLINVTVARVF